MFYVIIVSTSSDLKKNNSSSAYINTAWAALTHNFVTMFNVLMLSILSPSDILELTIRISLEIGLETRYSTTWRLGTRDSRLETRLATLS